MTGQLRNRRRPRALLATTALSAALAGLGTAPALAVTDDEAESLRQEIVQTLADPGYPGWTFSSGEVTAEVVDDGYNFVIPDLVVTYDQPEADVAYGEPAHVVVQLDDLNLRLVPDPVDPDLMKVDAHFGAGSLFGGGDPVEFQVGDGGSEGAIIQIGKHQFSGEWSDSIHYFTSADLSFQDVVATPLPGSSAAAGQRVTIDSISGNSSMTEVSPGLWDGSGESVFENITVTDGDETPFHLGRFTLNQSVGGFAFGDYMEWVRSSPMMMGERPEYASEEEAAEDMRQLLMDFPTMMNDFSLSWSIADLDAGDPGEHVLIPNHEFSLSATGLAGDTSDWSLRLFLQGMTVPGNEVPPTMVPTLIDVNVGISDLPTGLGWQAMEDAVGTTDIQNLDQVGPMLGQQIVQLALQSQTGLDLGGQITWDTGDIQFTGDIQADPQSPMMASGGLNVVFNQMQGFIHEVESTMGAESAGPLTMIQALGQQEDDATVYDFQISGSNVLMNGQDVQPLMMMLGQ